MAQSAITRWIVRHGFLTKTLCLVAGVIVMLTTISIPFFNNSRHMSRVIKTRKVESQELSNKVSILSGLDEAILDERIKILDQALPPKKDVVLYLSTIDGLSRELNLNFGGISLAPGEVTLASASASKAAAPEPELPGLHTLETEISITGTEDNIYSFLRLIEESAPLMQIKDVQVSGLNNDNYTLSLRLGMLYAKTDIREVKGTISLFDEQEERYFSDLEKFRRFNVLSDLYVEDTGLGKSNIFEQTILQQ